MSHAFLPYLLSIVICACLVCGETPNVITVSVDKLYPEGIEYHEAYGFLLSSTTLGSIYSVQIDGTTKIFANDSRLTSTRGLHIDTSRNELLACNSDSVARINLDTAKVNNLVVLSNYTRTGFNGTVMPNDVVSDGSGNAYVTGSSSNIIWIIDGSSTPSIFVQDQRWLTQVGEIGLNGIEYVKNQNVLLVGHTSKQLLYKVDISTSSVTTVDTQLLPGIDGLTLLSDGSLVVVGNSAKTIWLLKSIDGWKSATVASTFTSQYPNPTTAAVREGEIFVSHAYFGVPDRKKFEIEKITFVTQDNKPDNRSLSFIILAVLLGMGIVCGVAFGVALYIRKRQQRYQQMELPTNEFDDTRGRSLSLPDDEFL
ncbi:LDL receptor-related protein [Acrasis kona]|uniref:LDL receptor-related protein n=1 Tax=Acrasis kona TaxID=1008807 RepID=A0AAW2ZQ65_9EUKA